MRDDFERVAMLQTSISVPGSTYGRQNGKLRFGIKLAVCNILGMQGQLSARPSTVTIRESSPHRNNRSQRSSSLPQNTKLKARHRLKSAASKNIPDRVRERVPVFNRSKGKDVPPRRLGDGS